MHNSPSGNGRIICWQQPSPSTKFETAAMLTQIIDWTSRSSLYLHRFLAGALSSIAVSTFCELLFGCMLSGDALVTRALSSIGKKGRKKGLPLIFQPKKRVSFSVLMPNARNPAAAISSILCCLRLFSGCRLSLLAIINGSRMEAQRAQMFMTIVCHPLPWKLLPHRHRVKAFFSSPCLCASVAIFFHGKEEIFFSFMLLVSLFHL